MSRRSTRWLPWAAALFILACDGGGPAGEPAATAPHADRGAPPPDAAPPPPDVGRPQPDAGAQDQGPPATGECVPDAEHFTAQVVPVLADCVGCHVDGGAAGASRYVLVPFEAPDAEAVNRARLTERVAADPDFGALLVAKPTNEVPHSGGRRFAADDPRAEVLRAFVARVADPADCAVDAPAPRGCALTTAGATPLRRLTDRQYHHTVAQVFGVELPEGLFPATVLNREFRTWPVNNTVGAAGVEGILLAAEHVATHAALDDWLDCGDTADFCAQQAAHSLAAQAWRRPLAPAERALLDLMLADAPPEVGLRRAVEFMLQAPQMLYLDERAAPLAEADAPPLQPGEALPLDQHALASRLSYFLTDAPPDVALRAAAAAGELSARAQVAAHARRLLQTPAARRPLVHFHRDWLDVWRLRNATRDPERYPQFGPGLVDAMLTELDLFITEVVWAGDGRFDTLLRGRATWVDRQLAAIYGLPDPGEGWHRVALGDDRPGVLTRTAFLAAHAYAGSSSPVRRGAFVLHDLLCENLDPPADVNMDLPAPSEEARTVRERLRQHWTDPACQTCHVRIDPLGFGFEHFGALGEWRDTWEDGIPIDATGEVADLPRAFDGAPPMIAQLAQSDTVRACYVRRWLEYALGRPATVADACTLDTLEARFRQTDGDLRNLLIDITLTDAFLRRAPEPEAER